MPKRTDLRTILIIGSGPIVIGQACEFDYSGTQACKALRQEGYRVVLVNSNPATIMTDPEVADVTYVEPITPDAVAAVLRKERPDALLPTMGGQTGLNVAVELALSGVLEEVGCELIGANLDAIQRAEDRELFKRAAREAGLEVPRSGYAHSEEEAWGIVEDLGLPIVIRPSFTLGGTGGNVARSPEEFSEYVRWGLRESPRGEVLVEESVVGWKEFELEVMRDKNDNVSIICSIENVDPMGVHTGDSITVAPAQTLSDREYQAMRDASIAIIRKVGVETGGSNIQFAVNPDDGRMLIIEMNPRVSRSSALASKATGFPIAKIAAKLAIGLTLDEIRNDITQKTPASFEPAIDYCVVKFPRFTFEKFPETEPVLTTQMRSVGEVMAIGRTFRESLQKAVRSLEIDRDGLDFPALTGWGEMGRAARRAFLENNLRRPGPERVWQLAQAFREGFGVEECYELTRIDPWFLRQFRELVALEGEIAEAGAGAGRRSSLPPALLRRAKRDGFSDAAIGRRTGRAEGEIRRERHAAGLQPVYKRVDTCAAEFEAYTPYLYSTYEEECEARPTDRPKVLILGSGPNRIGQGIEFDYCCVHAVQGFAEAGYESIMVNCNPETVSTDYDTSDRLYFEPLTLEDVLAIIETEKPRGVVVQFGGQTPLKLAIPLLEAGAPILGTSPESIDLAEDRRRFSELLRKLRLAQPPGTTATSLAGARDAAVRLGFPLLVRPSYVLGGRAMQVVHDMESLLAYMTEAVRVSPRHPVLIDRFLADAVEVDVDAVSDGERAVVGGVMEHIEEAGIHSGDSACALPPYSLGPDVVEELKRQTRLLARALNVLGLINVQFAVQRRQAYVLEVNPRASRTVPFVSKVTGVPLARIAARVMAGAKLADLGLTEDPPVRHVGVKEAVFPFKKFPGVDVLLGPEMKSTGEVMGLGRDFPSAFLKAQLGAGEKIPLSGTAFVSVRDEDKAGLVPPAQMLVDLGFKLLATEGTHQALATAGVPSERVPKVTEGVRPHCVDRMGAGEVSLVINTTRGRQAILDSYTIRRTALVRGIFYCTTLSAAQAAVRSIAALQEGELGVRSLQEYHGVVRAAARALH